MKIDSVGAGKIISFYKNSNYNNIIQNKAVPTKDTIEISTAGKNLSNLCSNLQVNRDDEYVASIRNEISNGTYNIKSSLVAQKIVDYFNGREV